MKYGFVMGLLGFLVWPWLAEATPVNGCLTDALSAAKAVARENGYADLESSGRTQVPGIPVSQGFQYQYVFVPYDLNGNPQPGSYIATVVMWPDGSCHVTSVTSSGIQ